MKRYFLVVVIVAAFVTTACGLMDSACPSDYPVDCNDGTCCPSGYVCNGDVCSSGGGGGGGSELYVSANGCSGGATVSYRGYNHDVCLSYYNYARQISCTKILWKC